LLRPWGKDFRPDCRFGRQAEAVGSSLSTTGSG
jgi:hypothetical protein